MARPIEDTRTLDEQEWKKFEEQLHQNRNKKATEEEFEALKKNFESFGSPFLSRHSKDGSKIR